MNITQSRYCDLPEYLRQELDRHALAEFGGFSLVRETAWATPDWSFRALEGRELACFYSLVQRVARFDGEPTPVAGLNNLVTLPPFRGRGLASRLLRDTESFWFDTLQARYGLLLCADALLPFYARLGWQRVQAPVRYSQPTGERAWIANAMVLAPDRALIQAREIDLCGLPW
jgi:GNAT superfamily N-acetyltransferase